MHSASCRRAPGSRLAGAVAPASLPSAAGLLSASLVLTLAALMAAPSQAQTACTAATEEDLRLIGGDVAAEGSVQICHIGDWRHVCDDRWAKVDADVACKQLGYAKGAWRATIRSEFVSLTAVEFWLDEVECTGSETKLAGCANDGWGVHNCQFSERAGVVCKANEAAAGKPAIYGTARVGIMPTTGQNDIADADGPPLTLSDDNTLK